MQQDCKPATPAQPERKLPQAVLVLYLNDVTGIPYTSDAAVAEAFANDQSSTLKALSSILFGKLAFSSTNLGKFVPRRAFTADPEAIRRLVADAKKQAEANGVRGYQALEFDHYFLIPIALNPGESLKKTFEVLKSARLPRGGRVYLSLPPKPATPSSDYLGPADKDQVHEGGGIGAAGLVADDGTAIDGAGQAIVVVEKAWLPNTSRPLPVPIGQGSFPESDEIADISHGTSVASIIVGGDLPNGKHPAGIAPQACFFKATVLRPNDDSEIADPIVFRVADAVVQAAVFLREGWLDYDDPDAPYELEGRDKEGVILIEQATAVSLPIECEALEFAAISTAAAAGLIVIEPAGNGAHDLDEPDFKGKMFDPVSRDEIERSLNPEDGDPTSGAIAVAAGNSGRAKSGGKFRYRWTKSNHGGLIDCWSWGDSIDALDVILENGAHVPVEHESGFAATSGAAAIVAGAVVLIRQMWRMHVGEDGPPLTPKILREMLRGDATSVPGIEGMGDLKGKFQPDLERLKALVAQHAVPVVPPTPVL